MGWFEPSSAFHPDLVGAVDEHIRDSRLSKQPLERSEAGERVDDIGDDVRSCEGRFLRHDGGGRGSQRGPIQWNV